MARLLSYRTAWTCALCVVIIAMACSGGSEMMVTLTGDSMKPAFCKGDKVALKKVTGDLPRYSIVFFSRPLLNQNAPPVSDLKRIIGLPGESVEVRSGGIVYINGTALSDDEYALTPANYTFMPMTVPAGEYFVLGDARNNSFDSHAYGGGGGKATISAAAIAGFAPADTQGCKSSAGS